MDHGSHFSAYMPHGHCYLWEPALVGIHVVSDALIGLAYLSISISLYFLVRKIRLPFTGVFLAFGVFIGACGLTHFMEVWNLWQADYWLSGSVKVITALASVITALWLFPITPKVLAVAESARLSEQRKRDLELAYAEMETRVHDRTVDLSAAKEREAKARAEAERLYQAAERASRMKDEFLATVSHELRTPLNVIMGYGEMLAQDDLTPEEVATAVSAIRRNSFAQSQLINDLLDVSMIITGKLKLSVEVIDLSPIIKASAESIRPAADSKSISVHLDIDRDDCLISGDPTRLQQIFWNLLSNAVKFTPREGEVWLSLKRVDTKIHFVVRDTGVGIEPEFLPFVFDRFVQEDSSTTRSYGGLGLGLGIVRHLTELHGGFVRAESAGKGKGATFTVELPVSALARYHFDETKNAAHQEQKGQIPSLSGRAILVVDDELDVRRVISSVLKRAGAEIVEAASAAEALEKLKLHSFDLLLCDVGMPVTDGLTLMKSVRELELTKGVFTPAIALTAYAQESDRNRAMAAGFQAHVAKPVLPNELINSIIKNLRAKV